MPISYRCYPPLQSQKQPPGCLRLSFGNCGMHRTIYARSQSLQMLTLALMALERGRYSREDEDRGENQRSSPPWQWWEVMLLKRKVVTITHRDPSISGLVEIVEQADCISFPWKWHLRCLHRPKICRKRRKKCRSWKNHRTAWLPWQYQWPLMKCSSRKVATVNKQQKLTTTSTIVKALNGLRQSSYGCPNGSSWSFLRFD